ncbi:MJ0042 family finger-like domain-containing protein [Methylobacterium phyllostachyos]|uniref:MJ0042 family finger-like domain-containing protein n=2 Tax=Methylobacterium phyllostachyos TaxID=582672 RepID=A0A1G9Z279_9HYPH|nr:zinc-ribbon domain-containing protein [Methylobacterium phyllostachyos]SDN15430.1 MJ0042 family finger-like domain-containing protein [Methylobacterium phyllostachyos]
MLIVCPSCASAYQIEAGKVGLEGRSVRCAACRETWFLTPADVLAGHESELAAKEEADPVSDTAWEEAAAAVRQASDLPIPAIPLRPFPRAKIRPSAGLSPSLAFGLALLAALPLACLARASVVRMVPQAAALFARIGLPVNVRGIEIRDVVAFSNPAEEGQTAELVVEGDLVGIARSDVPVGALNAEIRDAAGRVLRTFSVPAPRAVLGQAEAARFRGSLANPPADGRAIVVRFASAEPNRREARLAVDQR